eukprot:TRINITY_DN26111_c0_g1_i2.p1 TRINITY_DN26111_c0_g1~~TRINITY_DN26111_c0_g1_i2.p1  ORF type:complete len:309 (+),score=59.91 TRINITY_DN26111_c0_g1_i2:63-929(+)
MGPCRGLRGGAHALRGRCRRSVRGRYLQARSAFGGHPAPPAAPQPSAQGAARRDPSGSGEIRVRGATNVGKLAGACKSELLARGHCSVQCVGRNAANQAMKALCIARDYLACGRLRGEDQLGTNLLLTRTPVIREVHRRPGEDFWAISRTTPARSLGGILHENLRTDPAACLTVSAAGPEALENAVQGVGFARHYCRVGPDCDFDIAFVPGFALHETTLGARSPADADATAGDDGRAANGEGDVVRPAYDMGLRERPALPHRPPIRTIKTVHLMLLRVPRLPPAGAVR